ncbi:uncharacterized protein LAESUDRAFT_753088 [Laetiporus sulphureus 93-53]|uniref:Carbohydrate-binding module family 19 domain-containing protein n=1 Tax=Laetiporus sulphureus 93-53 TaxID=1314785 RepID=A0A165BB09_9APHY|nr:uncharacterized protein LAESUDRAFT_753088 [Laetiporus sulphureus 93-53]KZT00649.1 hypothetical protein LAESUDRAFT_753088 [Laetiporus sulphureus 93-53]
MRFAVLFALPFLVGAAKALTIERSVTMCPASYTGYDCYGSEIIYCKDGEIDTSVAGSSCNAGDTCWASTTDFGCTAPMQRRQTKCPASYTGYDCYGIEIVYCNDGEVDPSVAGSSCDAGYTCWASATGFGCKPPASA